MIIFFLFIVTIALYGVFKTLIPEMSKPPVSKPPISKPSVKIKSIDVPQSDGPDNKIEKLENLLAEKNKNIQILQNELTVFLVQVREFNKIKSILEEEIKHLKEQNRIFRSELGIPLNAPSQDNTSVMEKSSTKPQ